MHGILNVSHCTAVTLTRSALDCSTRSFEPYRDRMIHRVWHIGKVNAVQLHSEQKQSLDSKLFKCFASVVHQYWANIGAIYHAYCALKNISHSAHNAMRETILLYSIWIFTHLKLCLADAIHNFKWVKIIQIWQNGGQLFSKISGWCHILSLRYLKCGT